MLVRCALAALLLFPSCASAPRPQAVLPEVAPESVGFSPARLERLDAAVQRLIDEQAIAGAVVLLARHGAIAHFEAYGELDQAAHRPMTRDALFRVCSMSKAVTSVGAMILYEEGRFLLDDPVSRFLPEFAAPQVLVEDPAGGEPKLVPANGPITIRQLLTHTSGIPYRFTASPALAERYAQAGITDGLAETDLGLDENVRRIAAQPLLHQPGERFTYGLSTDVLGRLIEVVSGQRLGAFLEERVFAPLGMRDTCFSVAAADRARLATVYRADQGKLEPLAEGPTLLGPLTFSPGFVYAKPAGAPRYESGGAGLVSTAADYARFCAMLAGGGELGGVRVLGRKTVELMEADHLAAMGPEHEAFGLGLGIAPDPGRSGESASAGTLGWAGFYTTRFWIDPREDLIGVVLTQTYPFDSGRAHERLMAAAYQALAD